MTASFDEPATIPDESGSGGLVRLRLDLAYDGSAFHGWARQPGLRSIQEDLEAAIRLVLGVPSDVPVRVGVAGRTDAGVHATGQVCHCDVPLESLQVAGRVRDLLQFDAPARDLLRRRLNGVLKADLRCREIGLAPAGFHSRWSASWRRYSYLVADDVSDFDPRSRGFVLWYPRSLDLAALNHATAGFKGEHDFRAFCRARPGASSIRTVHELGWQRREDGILEFAIRADAFCHSMVRSLVGAFLAVGDGRWPLTRPAALLAAGLRIPEIESAPAHGLTLVKVAYPIDSELANAAQRSRRWRG